MASITRNLNIESKKHLYRLINTNEELSSNKIFLPFMDSMQDYFYGCKCNIDIYELKSNEQYNSLSSNQEALLKLKDYFRCQEIIFN
jgi:hypothetical protein